MQSGPWPIASGTEVPAVLLYLDMDGFKSVNDSLGHAAGDAALVAGAPMLFLANLRESDAVGRLGGDEFALLDVARRL